MAKFKLNIQVLLLVVFFAIIIVAGSAVATGFATRPSHLACVDSDNGDVTVQGVFKNNLGLEEEDYCITPDILIEVFCDDYGKMEYRRASCRKAGYSQCVDGACV